MSLNGKDYPAGSPVYSFVDNEGQNTHIDSELLRKWCIKHHNALDAAEKILLVPVDQAIASSFVELNVVDLAHVRRVLQMPRLDPIIHCKTGTFAANGAPDVLMADGHHRYFCAWIKQSLFIPSYVLELEDWKPFEIIGLPSLTQGQLQRMPTKPRGKS